MLLRTRGREETASLKNSGNGEWGGTGVGGSQEGRCGGLFGNTTNKKNAPQGCWLPGV